MTTGKCKIKDGWANEDSIIVVYDNGDEHEIPASRYISQGYAPPIESLPSCPRKSEE